MMDYFITYLRLPQNFPPLNFTVSGWWIGGKGISCKWIGFSGISVRGFYLIPAIVSKNGRQFPGSSRSNPSTVGWVRSLNKSRDQCLGTYPSVTLHSPSGSYFFLFSSPPRFLRLQRSLSKTLRDERSYKMKRDSSRSCPSYKRENEPAAAFIEAALEIIAETTSRI